MAKKKALPLAEIVSIVLMVAGIGLIFWGYQISGSFSSKLTLKLTGAHTDKVMQLYIGGAASFVAGLVLYFKK